MIHKMAKPRTKPINELIVIMISPHLKLLPSFILFHKSGDDELWHVAYTLDAYASNLV